MISVPEVYEEKMQGGSSSVVAIVIVLLVLVGVGVGVFFLVRSRDSPPKKQAKAIAEKFNGPDGLFVTNFALSALCPDFVPIPAKGQKCVASASDCKSILDVSNFAKVNPIIAGAGVGPPCFQLSVSWIAAQTAQFSYGPGNPQLDTTVGVILDVAVLKPYIACGFLSDAGSQTRWMFGGDSQPDMDATLAAAKSLTDADFQKRTTEWNSCVQQPGTKSPCPLMFAGCGGMPPSGMKDFATSTKTTPGYSFTESLEDVVPWQTQEGWLPSGYPSWQPAMPYSAWEEYKKWVRQWHKGLAKQSYPASASPLPKDKDSCAKIPSNFAYRNKPVPPRPASSPYTAEEMSCADFWSYLQDPNMCTTLGCPAWDGKPPFLIKESDQTNQNIGNSARETEVTLFIPQKDGKGGSVKVTQGTKSYTPDCEPTDTFAEAWKQAILGVYCLPGHCAKDARFMRDLPAGQLSQCCSDELSCDLAKKVADEMSKSLGRTIYAYRWDSAARLDAPADVNADLQLTPL